MLYICNQQMISFLSTVTTCNTIHTSSTEWWDQLVLQFTDYHIDLFCAILYPLPILTKIGHCICDMKSRKTTCLLCQYLNMKKETLSHLNSIALMSVRWGSWIFLNMVDLTDSSSLRWRHCLWSGNRWWEVVCMVKLSNLSLHLDGQSFMLKSKFDRYWFCISELFLSLHTHTHMHTPPITNPYATKTQIYNDVDTIYITSKVKNAACCIRVLSVLVVASVW